MGGAVECIHFRINWGTAYLAQNDWKILLIYNSYLIASLTSKEAMYNRQNRYAACN